MPANARTSSEITLVNGSAGDPGLFIDYPGRDDAILFDAGENAGLGADRLGDLGAVFITHHHIDHFIGFDRIVRANLDRDKTLHVFGPAGTIRKVFDRIKSYEYPFFSFQKLVILVREVEPGRIRTAALECLKRFPEPEPVEAPWDGPDLFEGPGLRVEAAFADHTVPCLAVPSEAPVMAIDESDENPMDEATQDEVVEKPGAGPGRGRPAVELTSSDALERLLRGETIRNTRIHGLRIKGGFELPFKMEKVELIQPNFSGADFGGDVVLQACKIVRPTLGHGCRFRKGLSFKGSTIIKGQFRDLTVDGPWRSDNVRTWGQFSVVRGKFGGPVRFWDARLNGWAEFQDCTFAGVADFRSLQAEEGFKLVDCTFAADALFRGATFTKRWDAGGSRFDGLLDLSRAKLHDFAYLEEIQAGPGHRLAFHNAIAERILIRTEQVEGRLESEQAGKHDQAMHEYGLLKRVFEGLHRYEQEDWAFYRFKVNQRRSRPRSWNRPWSKFSEMMDWLFLDLGCGYGTNPFRAVRMSALLMLAFGLIYMVDVTALPVEKRPFEAVSLTHPLNRVMIGLLTSVSVFTSGFGSLRDAARGWMNVPLIAESLLGTLLWGLFIVAFSRKVIR